MSKNVDKIEDYIGTDNFNRISEIVGILGLIPGNVPLREYINDDWETRGYWAELYDGRTYYINLDTKLLGKHDYYSNQIRFERTKQGALVLDIWVTRTPEPYHIYWTKNSKDHTEELQFYQTERNDFAVRMETFTDGIDTSSMQYKDIAHLPLISSDCRKVYFYPSQQKPIKDYYSYFQQELLRLFEEKKLIPFVKREMIKIAIQVFQTPIEELLNNLTEEDIIRRVEDQIERVEQKRQRLLQEALEEYLQAEPRYLEQTMTINNDCDDLLERLTKQLPEGKKPKQKNPKEGK